MSLEICHLIVSEKTVKVMGQSKASHYIVCIGASTPPQKHHLLFLAKPYLNLQTIQGPILSNPPLYLYIGFSLVFLCKNYNPPQKGHPLYLINPPLKIEVLSSHPCLKIW